LIQREQYYLDLLKPEYNILRTAGSSAGYNHTEAAIELIRASSLKRRKHSDEVKARIGAGSFRLQPVIVTNIQTGVNTEFPTMTKAAEFLETYTTQVGNYIKSKKPFKGIYSITRK
ncbi:uncharacterized protein K452DRAFT_240071, partial [Aplosporella prunicola CBS 121167]